METGKKSFTQADKIVVVRMEQKKVDEKDLYLLFTAGQIEEVIPDITVRPVPFAPAFLQGVYSWRGHVVPVIDIGKRFGFPDTDETATDRFLVVRVGVPDNVTGEKIFRCVLLVSGWIRSTEASAGSSIVATERIGVDPSLIRGVYQQGDDFFVVPDLVSILQNKSEELEGVSDS